jgi:cytochrome c peroxidase
MQGVSHFPMILLLLTIILAQIPEQNAADQLVRVLGQGTCLAVPNRLASASKNMAALWLRATFHSAGTWKPNDPIQGGFDDLLIQTSSLKENTGLEESLAHQFVSGVSNSDSLAIAGIVAVQHCGGPQIRFASGRKDKKQRSFLANRIPTAFQNYDLIKSKLKEMGWNDEDIVALATGSHTLGGAHRENSPSLTDQPFVPFDDTPGIFDNNIFKFSLQGKCIIQFDCDVANDPELRPIVQRYF